jgi:arylsulfatase A-like enzyme
MTVSAASTSPTAAPRLVLMAMATALDDAVLNVTDALHTYGLWNTTLIVFGSDNGGVVADAGSNWPLRGGKFSN